jgi:hypothetical protein
VLLGVGRGRARAAPQVPYYHPTKEPLELESAPKRERLAENRTYSAGTSDSRQYVAEP